MNISDLVAAIGRALYGDRWKADMAHALGTRVDRPDDWSKGRGEPSAGIWRDLVTEIEKRQRDLAALKVEVLKRAGPRKAG